MSDSKPQHDPSMDDILASIRKIISDDEARAAAAPGAADSPLSTAAAPGPAPAPGKPATQAAGDDVLLLTDLVEEPSPPTQSGAAPAAAKGGEPGSARRPGDGPQPSPGIAPIPSPPKAPVMGINEPQPATASSPPRPGASPLQPPVAPVPPVTTPLPTTPVSAMSEAKTSAPSSTSTRETGGKVSASFEKLNRAVIDVEPAPSTPAPAASGGSKSLEDLAREMLRPMLQEWMDKNLPDLVEKHVQREIERMARR